LKSNKHSVWKSTSSEIIRFLYLIYKPMPTKKARYEQHVHKHGKNAVSESAFRKRFHNWRTIQQAIETPKLYANEYEVEKQKKKEEKSVRRERISPEQGNYSLNIKLDRSMILDQFNNLWKQIAMIKKFIKVTMWFLGIWSAVYILYRTVRLFAYIFWGM
jgi:hypothetical protein